MPSLARVKQIADAPLAHTAGGVITVFSVTTALVIVVVSYVLGRLASRAIVRMLARREVAHGARFALAKIVRYVIVLVGALVAVMSLGIRLDALLAASTVVLVGIGFGLQNIAQNFVSGVILLVERPVARGDFVQIGQAFGSVVDVGMRATRVVTRDEVTIIVPNSELITGQVVNYSVPTTNRRITVKIGVGYGSDMPRVRETLLAVAKAEPKVLPQPAPEVRFDDFGDSSLDVSLLVWIADPGEDLLIGSKLRFAIDDAFRKAEIEIPFPQRVVHMRSDA